MAVPKLARRRISSHLRMCLLALGVALSGCANNTRRPPAPVDLTEPAAAAGEGHGPEVPRHLLNGFAGIAHEDAETEGLGLGIDYEYRFSELFGVGAFTEFIAGEGRAIIVGADLVWHPTEPLSLFLGYGEERKNAEWEGVLRVGGLYEFPIGGGWAVSPTVAYDFSLKHPDEDVVVLGVSLGYGW